MARARRQAERARTEPHIADDDGLFDENLAEMERKHLLERRGRIAAEIEIDLAKRGPLHLYLQQRRLGAREALRALADIDPRDAVAIAQAQGKVREYLQICEWIKVRNGDAEEAAMIILGDDNGDEIDD